MYPQDYASVQQIRYYSKIDAWMVVVLCVRLLLPMILAVLGISSLTLPGISPGGSAVILLILVGPFVGVVALVLGLACPVYYEITPSTLLVHSGLLRRQIPLASIFQVFPTHSPVSGPAWSFDRLQVDYMHNGQLRSVLISPKDKLRFLHDLVSRAAGLEIRGERVVRRRWTHLSSGMEKPTDPLENVPGQKGPFFSPSRLVNVVAPLMLALQVLLTLLIYPLLPSIVPSHWDAAGHINSYSSKGAYVSFLPIFSLVLYVFLRVMFAFIGSQSRGQNLRMGQNILTFVIVGQQGLFLIIQAVLLLVALHAG